MSLINPYFDNELYEKYGVIGVIKNHCYLVHLNKKISNFEHATPCSASIGENIYDNSTSWPKLIKLIIIDIFRNKAVNPNDFIDIKSKWNNESVFDLIPSESFRIRIRKNLYMSSNLDNDQYVQVIRDLASKFGSLEKSFIIVTIPTKYEKAEVVDAIRARVIDTFYDYLIEERRCGIVIANNIVNDVLIMNKLLKREDLDYYDLFAGGFMKVIIEKDMNNIILKFTQHTKNYRHIDIMKKRLLILLDYYNYLLNDDFEAYKE